MRKPPSEEQILRYDKPQGVETWLDPFEDLISWIYGLRSVEHTSDIIRTKHNLTRKEVKPTADLITKYVENALGLLEQARSSSPEVSFLPLYYTILNLSKIYILLAGRRKKLLGQRYHGASYDPERKTSRDVSTEIIKLHKKGVFPLFYETLTGLKWNYCNRQLKLDYIYPRIYSINYEYLQAYNKPSALQEITLYLEEKTDGVYRTVAKLGSSNHPNASNKRYLKILTGFKSVGRPKTFVSKEVCARNKERAKQRLKANLRRYLIYPQTAHNRGQPYSVTPISNKQILLPEEVPIWLAFFHLSNVVRYNPEFLHKIRESKSWPMLLSLRKHAMFRFLVLFWSYVNQTYFVVSRI